MSLPSVALIAPLADLPQGQRTVGSTFRQRISALVQTDSTFFAAQLSAEKSYALWAAYDVRHLVQETTSRLDNVLNRHLEANARASAYVRDSRESEDAFLSRMMEMPKSPKRIEGMTDGLESIGSGLGIERIGGLRDIPANATSFLAGFSAVSFASGRGWAFRRQDRTRKAQRDVVLFLTAVAHLDGYRIMKFVVQQAVKEGLTKIPVVGRIAERALSKAGGNGRLRGILGMAANKARRNKNVRNSVGRVEHGISNVMDEKLFDGIRRRMLQLAMDITDLHLEDVIYLKNQARMDAVASRFRRTADDLG